jgi:hypothetical protein
MLIMSKDKRSKRRMIVIVVIAMLVLIVVGVLVYSQISASNSNPKIFSIDYLDELDLPHIDLRDLETTLLLEFKPNDESEKSLPFKLTSHIIKTYKPIATVSIIQQYNAYLSNSGSKIVCEPFLHTEYYAEQGNQTIQRVLGKHQFYGININGWREYHRDDPRFDECYVSTYKSETRPNNINIIVVKNKQIMYLQYDGGNLNPEDFLDELAKIL